MLQESKFIIIFCFGQLIKNKEPYCCLLNTRITCITINEYISKPSLYFCKSSSRRTKVRSSWSAWGTRGAAEAASKPSGTARGATTRPSGSRSLPRRRRPRSSASTTTASSGMSSGRLLWAWEHCCSFLVTAFKELVFVELFTLASTWLQSYLSSVHSGCRSRTS